MRTTVINQNCIHEEIKSRLNSGNACYLADQNLLSYHLLSKIVRTKTELFLHAWGRLNMSTMFWAENVMERDQFQDLVVDGSIILT
jgi:hypothetical protein